MTVKEGGAEKKIKLMSVLQSFRIPVKFIIAGAKFFYYSRKIYLATCLLRKEINFFEFEKDLLLLHF